MFIVYTGADEVLVTTKKKEKQFLEEHFGDDADTWEYVREEVSDPYVRITSSLVAN